MGRVFPLWIASALLASCGTTWKAADGDGDGTSAAGGDCWDRAEGPPGSSLSGSDIGPDQEETWYDGIDQDCGGDDDFDADGDGWVRSADEGKETWGVPGSGELPVGDCWDGDEEAAAFVVVPPEYGTDENGASYEQIPANDVNPGQASADDTWYDGIDRDCAGNDDFDQDGDGYRSMFHADATGAYGDDCIDGSWLDDETTAPLDDPAEVNPGMEEVWYDGIDQDCEYDATADCDQDGDGFWYDGLDLGWCLDDLQDCLDTDPLVFPTDAEEVYYNGSDDNCNLVDGDGDADSDGWWAADYEERLAAAGLSPDETVELPSAEEARDCWDDPEVPAADAGMDPINGASALLPEEVHPEALDRPYDDVDQDCLGTDLNGDGATDDFDWDADGVTTEYHPERAGGTGADCIDCSADCEAATGDLAAWCAEYCAAEDENPAGLDPAAVNPDAADEPYDGTDADCDDWSDYDADRDGYDTWGEGGTDCVDDGEYDDPNYAGLDPEDIHPGAGDTWYDGTDQDCDGNDGDADGDGYYISSWSWAVPSGYLPGDCDDESADAADTWPGAAASDSSTACMKDADGDGYGDDDPDASGVTAGTDCDDDLSTVNPSRSDAWYDGVDTDCDGADDYDKDGDGYVPDAYAGRATTYVSGSGSLPDGDCDDTKSGVNPGKTDAWYDGVDNDCDGRDDYDQDEDGYVPDAYSGLATTYVSGSGALPDGDCDDTEADANPGETETCSTSFDDDCDGDTNDTGATGCTTWYSDTDSDGYGNASLSKCTCTAAGTYTATNKTDCDDTSTYAAKTYPGVASSDSTTACMKDYDGDKYGDDSPSVSGVSAGTDCDDTMSAVKPGATEKCSTSYDDDCDGDTNDLSASGCTTYYADTDGDSYGSTTVSACYCTTTGSYTATTNTDCDDTSTYAAKTYPGVASSDSATACMKDYDGDKYGDDSPSVSGVSAGTDCDDTMSAVKPGATEKCSTSYDDDCDGDTNDLSATGCTTYYADTDGDSYGSTTVSACYCTTTGSYTTTNHTDCDDTSTYAAKTYPGAASSDSTSSCMKDYDGDRYGDDSPSVSGVSAGTDCDDTSSTIKPGGTEKCSTTDDDDCDGDTNDLNATGCTTYYANTDGDSYGSMTVSACYCSTTGSYTTTDHTDCDDTSTYAAKTYPGAATKDSSSACMKDYDGDKYGDDSPSVSGVSAGTDCDDTRSGVKPGATEKCSTTYDDDCDDDKNDAGATGCATYYADTDGDNFGSTSVSACYCTTTGSYTTTNNTDCDDTSSAAAYTWPGAASSDSATSCMKDADEDEYGDDSPSASGVTAGTDCDDATDTTNPGATETCATEDDDDCDGSANDAGADECVDYYEDVDGDDLGDPTSTSCLCEATATYTTTDGSDCDDGCYSCQEGSVAVSTDEAKDSSSGKVANYDDDCDGWVDEDEAAAGDLVLTEVMVTPAGSGVEWFEVYNGTSRTLEPVGWEFALTGVSASFCVSVDAALEIASGSYALFCAKDSSWATASRCDYFYGEDNTFEAFDSCAAFDTAWVLGTGETMAISVDSISVDSVTWTSSWPFSSGYSMQHSSATPDSTDNDSVSNWCTAQAADSYSDGGTQHGTPSAATTCP